MSGPYIDEILRCRYTAIGKLLTVSCAASPFRPSRSPFHLGQFENGRRKKGGARTANSDRSVRLVFIAQPLFTTANAVLIITAFMKADVFWSLFAMPIGLVICFGPALVAWALCDSKESCEESPKAQKTH
jgi:hypothetical protein